MRHTTGELPQTFELLHFMYLGEGRLALTSALFDPALQARIRLRQLDRPLSYPLLQFSLLSLQFGRQLLRLFQQAFGLHRCLDTVQYDADAAVNCSKNETCNGVKLQSDANAMTAFTRPS